jgi:plastocyanin
MERIKSSPWVDAVVGALTLLGASNVAQADTVMLPPPPVRDPLAGPTEQFAESRFGAPPARVDLGVPTKYAAREAEELDQHEEIEDRGDSRLRGSRAPAGLMFSNQAPTNQPRPVQIETGREPQPGVARPLSEDGAGSVSAVSESMKKGVQEIALIASDLGYFPKTLFVSRDVPVRIFVTGASKNTLCIMMDSFSVKKQVRSQKIEEVTFTPNVPGKYRFYCPVNGMEGSLIVKEFAAAQ